jgi:hypothetical protein
MAEGEMAKNLTAEPPWASGPGEILRHGLSLLRKDSDVNRRLAMLSIDNAVELIVKTYLGLPRRVTGISLTRREYHEISESFPRLLDAIQEHVADRVKGIDLGEIEWYHRVRNELYHEGNGLTVERAKVEAYAELAKLLFSNLFGFDLNMEERQGSDPFLAFMGAWGRLEEAAGALYRKHGPPQMTDRPVLLTVAIRALAAQGIVGRGTANEIEALLATRNRVVHGAGDFATILPPQVVERAESMAQELERRLSEAD